MSSRVDINFIQLNMRKAFVASVELSKLAASLEKNIVCLITEPFRRKGKICSIPRGFKCISAQNGARAAILYGGGTEILMVENLTNEDCAVGLIKINKRNIIIVSAYLDINTTASPEWMQRIIDYLSLIHI